MYRRHSGRPFRRWMELASYAGVFLGIFLIVIVCYFEFFAPDVNAPDQAADEQVLADAAHEGDDVACADDAQQAEPEPEPEEAGPVQGVINPGDTAGVLLQEWLSPSEAHGMVDSCKDVYSLAKLRAGQPYVAHLENGTLSRFEYEIDTDSRLTISREKQGESFCWVAKVEDIEYEIKLIKVEGNISSSLFETMSSLDESPALAVRLAEVFAWEINFIRDIQPDDSFRVLVEKRYRDGEFKGYGKMPIAEFTNNNKKFEAYLFQDSFGNNTYFNAAGESLKRAFLKAPLSFTRISSRFNLRRMHPILHSVRPHPAVDYAAPKGTPVKAIGSGTVAFRGYGKGAGNYIVLKHSGGYESMYMHLNAFAKNLKKGGKVRQGEVIGYVGSTGYSTGPHLDFRMKRNGQFLNPEKVLSPRDESVPKNRVAAFREARNEWRRYMDGDIALSEYRFDKEKGVQ